MLGSVEPPSAQDKEVERSIVVVIGVTYVESADFSREARCKGAVIKASLGVLREQPQLISRSPGRGHDIEVSIPVEIINAATAGQPHGGNPELGRLVPEAPRIVLGLKDLLIDQVLRGNLLRIFTKSHIGEIEQPPGAEVIWILG